MKIFAERLRQIQKEKGMTQAGLAQLLGIKSGTLANYLNDRKNPQIDTVAEMANKLGVTVGWLCGDEEAFPQKWTYSALSQMLDSILSISFDSVGINADKVSGCVTLEIMDDLLCEYYSNIGHFIKNSSDEKIAEELIKAYRMVILKDSPLPCQEDNSKSIHNKIIDEVDEWRRGRRAATNDENDENDEIDET